MTGAWSPGWEDRFREVVQEMGFDDVYAFVEQHPDKSLNQLYGLVQQHESSTGLDRICLEYFYQTFFIDALSNNRLKEAITESLLRSLKFNLRNGWNTGKDILKRRYNAKHGWPKPSFAMQAVAGYDELSTFQNAVWQSIENADPPEDWCPQSVDDPILKQAFEKSWHFLAGSNRSDSSSYDLFAF